MIWLMERAEWVIAGVLWTVAEVAESADGSGIGSCVDAVIELVVRAQVEDVAGALAESSVSRPDRVPSRGKWLSGGRSRGVVISIEASPAQPSASDLAQHCTGPRLVDHEQPVLHWPMETTPDASQTARQRCCFGHLMIRK